MALHQVVFHVGKYLIVGAYGMASALLSMFQLTPESNATVFSAADILIVCLVLSIFVYNDRRIGASQKKIDKHDEELNIIIGEVRERLSRIEGYCEARTCYAAPPEKKGG